MGGWRLTDEHSTPGGACAGECSCMGRDSAGEGEVGERGFVVERQLELFYFDDGAIGKKLLGEGKERIST